MPRVLNGGNVNRHSISNIDVSSLYSSEKSLIKMYIMGILYNWELDILRFWMLIQSLTLNSNRRII